MDISGTEASLAAGRSSELHTTWNIYMTSVQVTLKKNQNYNNTLKKQPTIQIDRTGFIWNKNIYYSTIKNQVCKIKDVVIL